MKKMFNEFGGIMLAAVVVALLIGMASPVGGLIASSLEGLTTSVDPTPKVYDSLFGVHSIRGTVYSTQVNENPGEATDEQAAWTPTQ